jgi:hypothetical protein
MRRVDAANETVPYKRHTLVLHRQVDREGTPVRGLQALTLYQPWFISRSLLHRICLADPIDLS